LINTYRYVGQRSVEKDGQKLSVPVNPQLVLNGMGPFIQVTITHPRIIQEEFKRLGRKMPMGQRKGNSDCILSLKKI
jgi:hypothetical protein